MRGRPWWGAASIAYCVQDLAAGITGLLVGTTMLAGGEGGGGVGSVLALGRPAAPARMERHGVGCFLLDMAAIVAGWPTPRWCLSQGSSGGWCHGRARLWAHSCSFRKGRYG